MSTEPLLLASRLTLLASVVERGGAEFQRLRGKVVGFE